METWLVTPLIDIVGPMTLSFETAKQVWVHDGLSVWVSTDFECDPTAATWTELNGAILAGQPNIDFEWIFSGDIDLSAYIGQKVAIGFKYVGSGPGGQTTTYRVDNVQVQ
ncbi:MAG: choice-of-anchor J domain-containing protein [Saprospiraceae bacterium]|nr:choice-of-anchor J domain-containing protein [Saprospiraceae bacterium]